MPPIRRSADFQASIDHLWHLFKARRCQRSRASLIENYRYLVTKTRQRIVPHMPVRVLPEDLEQEGYIALVRAVDQFDPQRKVKFESFAISMIRGAMLEFLRKDDWVPRSIRTKQKLVRSAEEELALRHGGENVRDQDMAAHLDMPLDSLYQLYREASVLQTVSLDDAVGDGEHDDLDPLMVKEAVRSGEPDPFFVTLTSARREFLNRCIGWLPPAERKVVQLYYFENLTLKQIAVVLERSESRAHQLHSSAIKHLRQHMQAQRPLYASDRDEAETVAVGARVRK